MKKTTKLKKIIESLIKDRKYLDLWSLGHFLFGIIIGFLVKHIGFGFITSLFLSLFVMSLWEIIEPRIVFKYIIKKSFNEKLANQITDIICGFLGFLVYWFFIHPFLFVLILKMAKTSF